MAALIKDPTEVHETHDHLDTVYTSLGKSTEYWAIIGRGAFVFRFGPYTGPEAGAIMKRAVDERIAVTIVGQCGREFDWEAARDLGMRLVLPEDRRGPIGWFMRLRKRRTAQ
jgi:hypothetical protein